MLCCNIIKLQRALYCKILQSDTHVNEVKPVPIMLEILPIILSRISQKSCPLFF